MFSENTSRRGGSRNCSKLVVKLSFKLHYFLKHALKSLKLSQQERLNALKKMVTHIYSPVSYFISSHSTWLYRVPFLFICTMPLSSRRSIWRFTRFYVQTYYICSQRPLWVSRLTLKITRTQILRRLLWGKFHSNAFAFYEVLKKSKSMYWKCKVKLKTHFFYFDRCPLECIYTRVSQCSTLSHKNPKKDSWKKISLAR